MSARSANQLREGSKKKGGFPFVSRESPQLTLAQENRLLVRF